jgi:hypothetical protein
MKDGLSASRSLRFALEESPIILSMRTPEEILRSEKISPFDIAETAVYLATLGKFAVVPEVVVHRLGADW